MKFHNDLISSFRVILSTDDQMKTIFSAIIDKTQDTVRPAGRADCVVVRSVAAHTHTSRHDGRRVVSCRQVVCRRVMAAADAASAAGH